MEPALAAQFPEVKSYRGQGVDDPTATTRFDWSPNGFHAIVLSATGTVFIDPYTADDKRQGQRWPQQGQRNAPELLPWAGAIGMRRLIELARDSLQTGKENEHDEWGHLPRVPG